MKRVLALTLIPAMALAGCGLTSSEEKAASEDGETQDMTPEGPSLTAQLFGGGEPMALNIQEAHPNRVVLQLTSLQVKPSETVINAIVTNGRDSEVRLNQYGNDDTYLVTGSGTKLFLSAPTNNEQLTIQPGQRMEAELVFLGQLPEGETATLIVNDGNQTSNQHTNTPGFRINLPLEEAAFSDDGSKKN
ncbi:hypothetical protein [Qipengyuania sp. JC766]|uniref:hypothetical protein n=1 Tax=Qipengyuania sp. JC766 TaxID=3232139 RepID=UPI0034574D3D